MKPWNLLYRPGCPGTHKRFACFYLLSAKNKHMCLHALFKKNSFILLIMYVCVYVHTPWYTRGTLKLDQSAKAGHGDHVSFFCFFEVKSQVI